MGWIISGALFVACGVLAYLLFQKDKALKETNERLTTSDHVHRVTIARDMYFARLLGGGYYQSDAEFTEAGRTSEAELPHKSFIVISARLETWGELFHGEGAMTRQDMLFVVRNVFQNAYPSSSVAESAEYRGKMVTILNLDSLPEQGMAGIRIDTQKALEFLDENFDISITAAISRKVDSYENIHTAYTDTERIFEYLSMIEEDRQVVCYDDLTHHNFAKADIKFLQIESKMLSCIRGEDYEGVSQLLHEVISAEFYVTKPTIDIYRFRVYGIINSLLYMLEEVQGKVDMEYYSSLDIGRRIAEAESVGDILRETDAILDELGRYSAIDEREPQPKTVAQIKEFVDKNFRDINITVAYVAEHFDINASYCSRVFKRSQGEGLFDYIQKMRVEEAKRLLEAGESVKTAAEKVGFTNTLMMNRSFKRYVGLSPSKFRQNSDEG